MKYRRYGLLMALAIALNADPATASYTIDLIWSDTGTPTLSVVPGDGFGTNAGACAAGFLNTNADGRCLEVRLTATASLKAAIVTIGWNAGSSGVVLGSTGLRSFGQYGGGLAPAGPVLSKFAGTADCAPACDTAYGSFGGAGPSVVPAGVYTIGSINFDTSGVLVGVHDFIAFLRTGVDGAANKKGDSAPIQVNGAILNIVPEPGTLSLLGLGVVGLAAGARRRKS